VELPFSVDLTAMYSEVKSIVFAMASQHKNSMATLVDLTAMCNEVKTTWFDLTAMCSEVKTIVFAMASQHKNSKKTAST